MSKRRERNVEDFLNTSVDDCRSSIGHISDVEFLQRLEAECARLGHKTRKIIVRRRLNRIIDAKRGAA